MDEGLHAEGGLFREEGRDVASSAAVVLQARRCVISAVLKQGVD